METAVKKIKEPTGKYLVFILLYVGWCISYIDRAAINIALASIGKEFSLNPSVMGMVLSVFFVGYALMQLPGGWLADRFGSKRIIVISLLVWSAFTAVTGLAWSLTALIVIRLLFGLGEGAFPCASLKGVAEHFPRSERPKMTAGLLSSNYVGSAIAPMIVAPLLIYLGWRHMFGVIGIAGVAFVLVYWFAVRPAQAEEVQEKPGQTEKVGLRVLLKMPLMWQLVLAWFGLSLVNKGLDSWMPTYLLTVRHLDLKAIGLLTPLPFIAAGTSTAIGGWVMDRFFDGREKYMLMFSALLTAFFLYFMYTAETVYMVIGFQCLVYFFKSFVLAAAMSLPTKLLPGKVVGSASGMINVGGQSAGFISPVIIGFMISIFDGSYDAAFWFLIGAACLSAFASMTMKSGKHTYID
ncbi:MAG: MFS transporter [Sporomusaceae bacterium]|nr:MFS transporter [Sporomusaceae bacterium]